MNVLILFTNDGLALNVIRCLAPLGINCYMLGQGEIVSVRLSKHCRECLPFKFNRENPTTESIDAINEYCRKKGISCILPVDVEVVVFLTKIKDRLTNGVKTIPLAPADLLEKLDDKWEFAQLLQKSQLPAPRTFLVNNLDELKAIDLPFPRVVKPVRGRGRWITGGDPGEYIKKDMNAYLASGQDTRVFPLLVQEFIPGWDVDLSVLAVNGKIVIHTIKKFVTSERIDLVDSPVLVELGRRLVADIQFNGIADFDLRLDERDGSFKFLECNPRFWGSLRASMWDGMNFPETAINLGVGKPVKQGQGPRGTTYVLPSKVLSRLFKGDFGALKGLPDSTKKDIWQIVGDPLTCIYTTLHR
jgi:predicted ATP-grasp superfamily ATP-dependent carboligase